MSREDEEAQLVSEADALFNALDADGDGLLDRHEWINSAALLGLEVELTCKY